MARTQGVTLHTGAPVLISHSIASISLRHPIHTLRQSEAGSAQRRRELQLTLTDEGSDVSGVAAVVQLAASVSSISLCCLLSPAPAPSLSQTHTHAHTRTPELRLSLTETLPPLFFFLLLLSPGAHDYADTTS